MMSRNHEAERPSNPDDQKLPPPLAAAVDRARARRPAPDQVAGLVARLSEVSRPTTVARPRQSSIWRWTVCVVVAAASVLVVVTVSRQFRPLPKPQEREIVVVPSPSVAPRDAGSGKPVVSEVTKVPLVAVSFVQIEEDIREAESQLTLAAEAIAMAELRRDLRMTLDEYPRWER